MLYPHLLTGLQLADGGRIVVASPTGYAVISHGVRLKATSYHTLTLSDEGAAELQRRLDEASSHTLPTSDTDTDTDGGPTAARLGDLVVLEQQPRRLLRWEITAIDQGDNGEGASVTLQRGGDTQTLSWSDYCCVYSGHIQRAAS